MTLSEFDTPVTANDNPGRTDKDASLEENISKSSATPTMLEAPGKFVSRDMLSRTPLCPPPAPGDDSFPPPPPSEEMEAAKSNPEGMSRQISQEYDLPPPPDVFVTEVVETRNLSPITGQDPLVETPFVGEPKTLPTGRQLARTPATSAVLEHGEIDDRPVLASAQLISKASDLPSGHYAIPEKMEKNAYDNVSRESQENIVKMEEYQRKEDQVRKQKREEAELKRKKIEIDNFAKEEKRKAEEEKKKLEEMRKDLMRQHQKLVKEEKRKLDEEKMKLEEMRRDLMRQHQNLIKEEKRKLDEEKMKLEEMRKDLTQQQKQIEIEKMILKREGEKLEKYRKLEAKHSPKIVTYPSNNIQVSSSVEDNEEETSVTSEVASIARNKVFSATADDINDQPQSLMITHTKPKRRSREEILKEKMKANVEKRKKSTEEMLRRMEEVKEQAKIRREELERERNIKSKKLQEESVIAVVDPTQIESDKEPMNQNVTNEDDTGKRPLTNFSSDNVVCVKNTDSKPGPSHIVNEPTKDDEDKTVSKTILGRRRARHSNISLIDDTVIDKSLCPVAALESPTKKLKLDKKLSLSSKKKNEPLIKVSKKASMSTIEDVDSEESPLFAPLPKPSKRRVKNPEPNEKEPNLENSTQAKSRHKLIEDTRDDVDNIEEKSRPKRGRSKKKVAEQLTTSFGEDFLNEKKPSPRKNVSKRKTNSKKKLVEEIASNGAEEETRTMSRRLDNLEITDQKEVSAPEEKLIVRKGRGRKPSSQVSSTNPDNVEEIGTIAPHVEPDEEVTDAPIVSRGRPKRTVKKKFETLADFTDR